MSKTVIATVEVPLFVKRKHELADLLKLVQRGSKDGVELMIATLNSTEEAVTLKTKLAIAETLVDLEVRISDQISKDQLTRQIAEIKVKGLSTPLEPGVPKRLPPTTDFSTIQFVE